MKKFSASAILSLASLFASAQFVYKIKGDSILLTNDSCNTELILENSTKNVNGFLYNKGNGRTEFRHGVIKLNDSLYLIGSDTLKTSSFTTETDPTISAIIKNIPITADATTNKYLNWNGSAYVRKQVNYSDLTGSVPDLSGLYVRIDGSVPLTGNWNKGAFTDTYTKTGAIANTVYDAFIATNTTSASLDSQMYGGFYHSIGRGWKINSTAASQTVDIRWGTIPVQGTANPGAVFDIDVSIAGGGFSNILSLSNTGLLKTANAVIGYYNLNNGVVAPVNGLGGALSNTSTSASPGLIPYAGNLTTGIAGMGTDFAFSVNSGIVARITSVGLGLGVLNPTKKLDVVGSLKFATGNQGLNKVLTSDSIGNADWVSPTFAALTGKPTTLSGYGITDGGGGATAISALTDVTLTSLATNDFLKYNGSAWINRTPTNVKIDLTLNNVDNTSDSTKNSATARLINKRITKRIGTVTSSATPSINTDNVDVFTITAETVDITSFTTNLSGSPTDGQTLIISITGTASRALSWGTSFEASSITLPTTTSGTNRLDMFFIWNAVTNKWRIIGTA